MVHVFMFWHRKNKFWRHPGAENKKKVKLKNRQFRRSSANYVVGFYIYTAFCIYTCASRSVPDSNYRYGDPVSIRVSCIESTWSDMQYC